MWQACGSGTSSLGALKGAKRSRVAEARCGVAVRAVAKQERSAGALLEYLEGVRKSMRVVAALNRVASRPDREHRVTAERYAGSA